MFSGKKAFTRQRKAFINRSGKCFTFSAEIAAPKNVVFGSLASAVTTKEVTDEDSDWPAQRESEKNAVCVRKPDGRANGSSRRFAASRISIRHITASIGE
jgi:hypothetical protein